jgi:hypothetical protein
MLTVHTLELGENHLEFAIILQFRELYLGNCLCCHLRRVFQRAVITCLVGFSLVPLLAGDLTAATAYASGGIV